jgi:hypothetical protein
MIGLVWMVAVVFMKPRMFLIATVIIQVIADHVTVQK